MPDRRDGFALLITITLLAFLVLLLVSLASLTRVETQVAANTTQLSQARANALFALNLAVGQLQKHAGPDQRVTARADIDAEVQTKQNANEPTNPYWTGVWDARPADPANPSHATAPVSVAPLAWLVSGNENVTDYENDPNAVKPSGAPVSLPDGTKDGSVWLLRKVVSNDISDTSEYPVDMGVRLAKSLIRTPAEQVPGAASGSGVTTGAYAWWVGDEGVKAKMNLADPYRTAANGTAEAAWRREAAPKPDPVLLAGSAYQSAFSNPTATFEGMREGMLSMEQMPLLHADLATAEGRKQTGGYFHDLTQVGQGVLADTLRGGLRRDLTRGLAAAPAGGSVAAGEIGDGVRVFELPAPGPYGQTANNNAWTPRLEAMAATPRWSNVRAWAANRAPANGASMDPVDAPMTGGTTVTPPTTSGHALMPVPVSVQIGYGADIAQSASTLKWELRLMLQPRIVLMNPYNVPIASADYTVRYVPSVVSNWRVRIRLNRPSGSIEPPDFRSENMMLADYFPSRQLAFNITDSFGPGEVKVYSVATDNTRTSGLLGMVPGLTSAYAYAQTASPLSEDAVPWFRDPDGIPARLEAMPADHPQITLSLGSSTLSADGLTMTFPAQSSHARYIQTESAHINPQTTAQQPRGNIGDGTAKMLRTIRFSLRNGAMDRVTSGNRPGQHEVPGLDYPPADPSSGVRMLIDNNPRAILSQRIGGWDSVASYVAMVANNTAPEAELTSDGENGFWGGSLEDDGYGTTHTVLFDVPRVNEEIVSLGRLAHVNWGVDGKHPAYPLGNSFASIFYEHDSPDYGYALNEAIWDRFFLSTLPTSLETRPAHLANARLRFYDPVGSTDVTALENGDAYQLAATRLMIDGAFNINSTSVEAWAAFLGSVQAADYAYTTSSAPRTDSAVRAFPRVRNLHDRDPADQTGQGYEWTGYRHLDGGQLKALAAQIVAGIKARGRPARSLAEFINRDLSQPATSVRNQSGIVQAAINAVVNTDAPVAGVGTGLDDLDALNPTKVVGAGFVNADNEDAAKGKLRSTGAPGFLLQSDLLTPLAPSMSVRSDTFRVRTYGEARNPATGDIIGRAWCEAVVQRVPEYVGGELADTRITVLATGSASEKFGRKFMITHFRWLGPEEI